MSLDGDATTTFAAEQDGDSPTNANQGIDGSAAEEESAGEYQVSDDEKDDESESEEEAIGSQSLWNRTAVFAFIALAMIARF
jgi:hypothetical protein